MLQLALACLLTFPPPTDPTGRDPRSDSVTAFVNVTVIPMDRERRLTGQTVGVRGGRIVAIGPVGRVKVPDGAARVEVAAGGDRSAAGGGGQGGGELGVPSA